MRSLIPVALLVSVAVATCGGPSFDLLRIEHLQPKGRVQDYAPDPEIALILAQGKEAIPVLIDLLESERPFENPPIDYWPEVREGDMALAVLCDLFLDPTWRKSTLPELCWDNVLERADSSLPAWELLDQYLGKYGRSSLAKKWRAAWSQHQDRIVWDEKGRYFKVIGEQLVACR